ncbi:MAG: c-type cytochrome [Candidatus Sericytochromatia bacterium]
MPKTAVKFRLESRLALICLCGQICLAACQPTGEPEPGKTGQGKAAITKTDRGKNAAAGEKPVQAWHLPVGDPKAPEVRYGQELIADTPRYLGPQAGKLAYAGNHLACANCHLGAGQQPDALGFVGISTSFPQYRARENRSQTLADRINGCMERSLDGRPLPLQGREMQAMLAYMAWLSQGYTSARVKGQGLPEIPLPKRAADPGQGQKIYARRCAACHQRDGQGRLRDPRHPAAGYLYPPLWGPDSFNTGAGMHRLITAARFISANMPLGGPHLQSGEAFDVAAFINSQDRPQKAGLAKDFPDRSKKPVDASFAPWNDEFSARQHRYGPFGPMLKARGQAGG